MADFFFVILGASGFVGEHLTKLLASKNQPVICFSRKQIINKLEKVKYHQINDYKDIIFPSNSIVYHLAETHHIKSIEDKGTEYIDEVVSLAKALLKKPFLQFIYASSAAVYSDLLACSNHTDIELPKGKTIYSQAKQAVEKIVLENNGTVVRITNTYGPGMSELNIFADILRQLDTEVVTLREATPIRDYLWIEDLVEGLYAIGKLKTSEIYNLASGWSISCEELCKLILKTAGKPHKKIQFLLPPRTSVINLDITKTQKVFNWSPKHSLKEGITKLLDYHYGK